MKNAGLILTILGSLMFLSLLNLAFTKYDLRDNHDLSKFIGGLAICLLLIAAGVAKLIKSRK